jgi:hypothetical protein
VIVDAGDEITGVECQLRANPAVDDRIFRLT